MLNLYVRLPAIRCGSWEDKDNYLKELTKGCCGDGETELRIDTNNSVRLFAVWDGHWSEDLTQPQVHNFIANFVTKDFHGRVVVENC